LIQHISGKLSKQGLLCFHNFAMIQTCTYPHSNSLHKSDTVESISTLFY